MQANNSPRFLKNVMIGLVASSAGAFIALPGMAMPEPTETGTEIEAIEEIPTPAAVDTLPEPGAEALEADTADAVEADAVEETVAEDAAMEEDAVAEEPAMEEDAVAEELEPSDADTVEAAEIETLSDEAVEASDTMDGEPVAEEPAMEEDAVAEELEPSDADTVEAAEIEALSDEAVEASDTMDGEPVAEDAAMEEDAVAEDAETMETEPVASEEEVNTLDFTIAQLTEDSESFEILAAALAAADLTETLGGEGPFTVFAPTDDAFAALPEGAIEQLLLPENKDVLVQVLTYHVVPGALMSTDLETGNVETVEGSEVAVDIADTVTVNNANVVVADVEASNGVIHIIDRVIIPPSPEADAGDATETTEEDVVAQ